MPLPSAVPPATIIDLLAHPKLRPGTMLVITQLPDGRYRAGVAGAGQFYNREGTARHLRWPSLN